MTDTSIAAADAPAAPKKRGFLLRLTRWVVVLLVLVALAPLALKLGFVRDFVAKRASAALGAQVTIAEASAWWTSGIELRGLVIGAAAAPLASVERVEVKVALFKLLTGAVDASVRVERPVVMLRRDAQKRWNTEDLVKAQPGSASTPTKKTSSGSGPTVALEIVDGVFEAHGVSPTVERVSDIDLKATLAADGALGATLGLIAEKAGLAGADARISFTGGQNPGQASPFEADVPALNLERLAGLIEGFTGLKDLKGSTSLSAKGTLDGDGRVAGTLKLSGQGFTATTAGGARVRLGRVVGSIDATQGAAGESAKGDLTLTDLELVSGQGPDAKTLVEPQVTARFDATRAPDGKLTLAQVELAAGQALKLLATSPLVLEQDPKTGTRVTGTAELTADLARLSALKAFAPQLASLTSGSVTASLQGRPGANLDVAVGARISNLVLAPGDLVADGFSDRDITLQAGVVRRADGHTAISVYGMSSAIARLTSKQPFVIQRDAAGGLSFAGPLDLAIDLDALTRVFGGSLGLAKGERVAGALTLKGSATGSADDGRLEAILAGTGLLLPPSWSANRAPGALDGRLLVGWTQTGMTLEASGVKGLGLTASGKASLEKQGETSQLSSAEANVTADLAQVRAWFGPKLGLDPAATLTGSLQSVLRITAPAEGLRLEGTTQTARLAYRATPAGTLLEESALQIEHTVALAQGSGPTKLEVLRLRGNGYQADLSGSSVGGGPGALDLKGTLDGDAARIAERIAAFLGPDMQDLKAKGQVVGRFTLKSQGDDLLAGSTTDIDLTLGTWTSSGAVFGDARLTVKRASTREPYLVDLVTGANGGSAVAKLTLLPQGKALAWTLASTLKGVDMGTIVTTGPASKKLAYVLPTLLPMNSSTPALSGKLDATLDLKAADLGGDAMLASLVGSGNLALTQGTLGQSSLFAALGAGASPGGGLGEVGKVLTQVAPAVGKELANFTRSMAFQEITSKFTIAQQRVEVLETRLVAQAHRLDLKGVVGFDQRVDLAARLWMGSKAGEELKRVLPDQTLPLRIRNTLDKPQVVPDLNASDLLKGALPNLTDVLNDPKKALDEAKKLKDRWKELLPK